MLGANPSPQIGKADKCLREVGKELRGEDTFHINDVGIYFGKPKETVADPYFEGKGPDRTGCDFCGSCMVGCPSGAKNTLDKNYLHLAEGLGVDIIPETEVTGVTPFNGGYKITTRKSTGVFKSKRTYHAKGAVFSGGVLGTVKLLMKCQKQGLLPNLSDQLGNIVRTNSEVILGVKSFDTETDWNDQIFTQQGRGRYGEIAASGQPGELLFSIFLQNLKVESDSLDRLPQLFYIAGRNAFTPKKGRSIKNGYM